MKKFLVVVLAIFSFVAITASTKLVEAAELVDEDVIVNGDFSVLSGELPLGDPAFGPEYGAAAGWGSGNWDSNVVACVDPLDTNNTVLRFQFSTVNFCSFFKFVSGLEGNKTYEISLDYLVIGETDNFGMRFAGGPQLEKTFYSGSSTDGWQHTSWEWTTTDGQAWDSIGLWMNTMGSTDNIGYIDNIVVKVKDTDTNLVSGGDIEGFLDYASKATIPTEEADLYGNTSVNASYGNGNLLLGNGWFHQNLNAAYSAGKYQIGLDYKSNVLEGQNLSIQLVDDEGNIVEEIKLIENGVDNYNGNYLATVSVSGVFYGIKIVNNTDAELDNLSLAAVIDYPFDADKTYYQSESMTVNGDFEAFATDTVFSEEQLEGAWGSVSLDNPATIKEVDGSKVIDLTAGAKTYSSAFLMMPDTLETGDLLRLSYDIKLVLSEDSASYTAIDTCLVGGSNTSYYLVNYKGMDFTQANKTSGAEVINYPITITAKENGWYHVSFDYQLTNRDLIQTNSLRFLFTAKSALDHMYIDNVNLYRLSDTPFESKVEVESATFADGTSVTLEVGAEKTLAYTINPLDATDKSVTFTSSNESVATVDANGKVKAIAKGACTITLTAADGITAEIAIIVNEAKTEPAPSKGCFGSVAISLVSFTVLAGAAYIIARKKEQE